MATERALDVLTYLDWWDYMMWRESHMLDLTVEWQRDLSWDECAELADVQPPMLVPGDLPMDADLAVALYWPAQTPH